MNSCDVSIIPSVASNSSAAIFHERGFIHSTQLFSPSQTACLVATANELVDVVESAGKWMKYFERAHDGRRLLNRVEYFFDFWPDLPTALERSQLPSLLLALFGGPYHLFKEKLNVKLAGAGGYAPHQDGPAWTMLKRESITVMIAVDDADEHNGALQVDANFSCGRNFLAHRQGQLLDQDSIAWATIPLRAGDVIAFSSFLPHRSFGNGSSRSRRAYFITYNAAADGNCRDAYFDFKRRAFPPEIERLGAEDIGQWRTRLSRDLL